MPSSSTFGEDITTDSSVVGSAVEPGSTSDTEAESDESESQSDGSESAYGFDGVSLSVSGPVSPSDSESRSSDPKSVPSETYVPVPQGMASPLGCVEFWGATESPDGDAIYAAMASTTLAGKRHFGFREPTVNLVVHRASVVSPLFVNWTMSAI